VTTPPGNSLEADQQERAFDPGAGIGDGLEALLVRIREELDFNDAKGSSSYRLGVHDALRFAEDAVVALLRSHGRDAEIRPRRDDA
jgi:homospermidine synthase